MEKRYLRADGTVFKTRRGELSLKLEAFTPLAKALRKHLGLKKGRKGAAGIVEVKCLGVCPRGAVTVVNGAQSREWLLVPEGADLDGVAAELGLID